MSTNSGELLIPSYQKFSFTSCVKLHELKSGKLLWKLQNYFVKHYKHIIIFFSLQRKETFKNHCYPVSVMILVCDKYKCVHAFTFCIGNYGLHSTTACIHAICENHVYFNKMMTI